MKMDRNQNTEGLSVNMMCLNSAEGSGEPWMDI